MASALAFHSADALGVAPVAPQFLALTAVESQLGLMLLGGGVAAMLIVAAVWRAAGNASAALRNAMQLLSNVLIGGMFGAGLAVSGMVKPAKVWG
jgi:hypothetical protein